MCVQPWLASVLNSCRTLKERVKEESNEAREPAPLRSFARLGPAAPRRHEMTERKRAAFAFLCSPSRMPAAGSKLKQCRLAQDQLGKAIDGVLKTQQLLRDNAREVTAHLSHLLHIGTKIREEGETKSWEFCWAPNSEVCFEKRRKLTKSNWNVVCAKWRGSRKQQCVRAEQQMTRRDGPKSKVGQAMTRLLSRLPFASGRCAGSCRAA